MQHQLTRSRSIQAPSVYQPVPDCLRIKKLQTCGNWHVVPAKAGSCSGTTKIQAERRIGRHHRVYLARCVGVGVTILSPVLTYAGFEIQLKILQTLPSLLQNYADQVNGASFFTVIQICSTLQSSKTPSVSSTSAATLQQLVTSLYEKVASEDSE
jgi:hypothetical protein